MPLPPIEREHKPKLAQRQHESPLKLPCIPATYQKQNCGQKSTKAQRQPHPDIISANPTRRAREFPIGAVSRGKGENEVKPIDKKFVPNIVETFKDQRIQGYQFAVLIFSPHYPVTIKPKPSRTMTDKTCLTYPPKSALRDYIVARPDGVGCKEQCHAEELLLKRFKELLARNQSSCKSIVLYTWLFPCRGCTRKIIEKLGQLATDRHVTVVYTCRGTVKEKQERISTTKLEKEGITVIKGKYNKKLQKQV